MALAFTQARSNEESILGQTFALTFDAIDREGRQWRLYVGISIALDFVGLTIDRMRDDGTFPSDLEEDEEDMYPPPVRVDLQDALQRVTTEFERGCEMPWTRIYTSRAILLRDEYEHFRQIVEGTVPIAEYR
jgi:hypothetical protein